MKFGICLSGALSKGAYQAGFMEAFIERLGRESIACLSGASVGACNAYGIASNHFDRVKTIWHTFNYPSLFSIWKGIVFQNHIDKTFNILFGDQDVIDIPIYVSSVSTFPKLDFHYVKIEGPYHEDMRKFMKGSIGFPILTGPQKLYKKRLHTDGGIIDNIPIYPLTTHDVDLIIVLHFDPKFTLEKRLQLSDKTILEIDLSVCNAYMKKSFDFKQTTLKQMYDSGYEYGLHLSDILNHCDTPENLRKTVNQIMKSEQAERSKYKALDTIPSKFNRLLTKYRHKSSVITTLEDQYKENPKPIYHGYCHDCEKKMTPKKHFRWIFFGATWWFGLGLLYVLYFWLFQKPGCPYCKKKHFDYI